MAVRIVEIHAAPNADELNTEWFVLENHGKMPFNTRNCGLSVSKRGQKRRQELGIIDPGFVIGPGEKMRVCTGYPGRKSHGAPPTDDVKSYNLLLNESILRGSGTVLSLTLRSLPVTRCEFDPDAPQGIRPRGP
jgi:hypothetical protein